MSHRSFRYVFCGLGGDDLLQGGAGEEEGVRGTFPSFRPSRESAEFGLHCIFSKKSFSFFVFSVSFWGPRFACDPMP